MKKNFFKKVLITVLALIIGFIVFYLCLRLGKIDLIAAFSLFKAIPLKYILIFTIISISIRLVLVLKWKLVLEKLDVHVSFWKLFLYRDAGYALSYISPMPNAGGEPIRAYLLKKKEGVPMTTGLTSILLDKTMELFGNFTFWVLGFAVLLIRYDISPWFAAVGIISIIVITTVMIVSIIRFKNNKGVFSSFLMLIRADKTHIGKYLIDGAKKSEKEISDFMRLEKKTLFIVFALSVVNWYLMYWEYKFSMQMLGVDVGLEEIFLIGAMIAAAVIMPIPASIGSIEAGQLFVASVINIPASVAIAFSMLIRARDLIWTTFGLGYLAFQGASITKLYLNNHDQDDEEKEE